ncbi:MAG TPA: two-component regulator propeller domain-containing protein, partial [Pyrinomonadaceae bacterium]|nr:two-component regulator propeller domain-containing protein [Pyrinomonadaceae bacterium]
MNPPKKLLAILLIIQFYFCFAECRNAFGQYSFDSWTTDNGLPQNGIREITQTPDGYLWFTTFDGLVRFDGVKFTTFGKGTTKGIINNRFTGIFCDKDGTIYASTMEDGTLTIYKSGIFTSYTSDQVPDRYVKYFKYDENGELVVLTDTGEHDSETWYYLRGGKFVFKEKFKKADVKINYHGKTGAIWKISANEIIEERDGNSTVYAHKYENFDSTIVNFEDSNGALWVGGDSLTRLKNGKTETFGTKEGFPLDSYFHSFWEEDDGSIWFANGGRTNPGLGLVRYKDGKFTSFGKESGLSDTSIYKIFKDREGTVWIATNKGLNRLRKNIITGYSTQNGLRTAETYPIFRNGKDEIWVGTIKGLSVFRNGHFEDVDFVQTGKINSKTDIWRNREMSIQALFEDSNGKMWIGVAGGIYTAQNGEVELVESSEGHHTSAFYQDKNGIVWAATSKGILRFNNYKLENFYSVKDGLPNEFMTSVFEDSKGRLWFGGFGGLSEFKDGNFVNYTNKEGLAGNYVRSIYEDKDQTLWIGTYDEGLSRFKDGLFTNYKAENGLYNNGVFAIREDARGYFWISSNRGIYRVSRQELNDFADGKISKITSVGYGKQDGMLNNECNGGRQPASITDADGNFWFPTQDGVAIVNPSIETFNSLAPSVVIESVTVERQNADIIDGLKVEPGLKNIEINFTGISLIKSEQIKFKYK